MEGSGTFASRSVRGSACPGLAGMRKGNMSTLEQAATQIVNLQPDCRTAMHYAPFLTSTASNLQPPRTDISKAIEVAPHSQLGYVQLGNLKFVQRQYADAAQAYQEALDRDPNSTDALRGLMNTYLAQKQVDKALAAANLQIAKSPNNSSFYDLLGTVLFEIRKTSTARRRPLISPWNLTETILML